MKNEPRLIWNMDETEVSCETGRKLKVIAPENPMNVANSDKNGKGIGMHLTAVVIANEAGVFLPSLLLFEERKRTCIGLHASTNIS